MKTPRVGGGLVCILMLGAWLPACSQVPAVPEIPLDLSGATKQYLSAKREQFTASRSAFIAEATAHNQRCHEVPLDTPAAQDCAAARGRLTQGLADLQLAADALRVEIGAASGRKALATERRIERMVAELPKVDEIEQSAGAGEAHKALDAAAKHDWVVALAWWRTALRKDPGNESLKRSVALAQWMADRAKGPAKPASDVNAVNEAIGSAVRGDVSLALKQIEAMKAEGPAPAAEADRLTAGILEEETLRSEVAHPSAPAPPSAPKGERALSDELYESALEAQLVGGDKIAEELFKEADFFYMLDRGKPFAVEDPSTKQ